MNRDHRHSAESHRQLAEFHYLTGPRPFPDRWLQLRSMASQAPRELVAWLAGASLLALPDQPAEARDLASLAVLADWLIAPTDGVSTEGVSTEGAPASPGPFEANVRAWLALLESRSRWGQRDRVAETMALALEASQGADASPELRVELLLSQATEARCFGEAEAADLALGGALEIAVGHKLAGFETLCRLSQTVLWEEVGCGTYLPTSLEERLRSCSRACSVVPPTVLLQGLANSAGRGDFHHAASLLTAQRPGAAGPELYSADYGCL